jgi:Ca2+/Na+ antiporter
LVTRKILGEENRLLSSSLCSFLHSLVTSSLLGSNILPSTLFSNTLSRRSSLKVRDQVSHSYKTKNKIIVLHILIFVFLDNKTYSLAKYYWLPKCTALYTRLKMSTYSSHKSRASKDGIVRMLTVFAVTSPILPNVLKVV